MKSKPNVVLTTANYFETGVDETSGIILKNPDGELALQYEVQDMQDYVHNQNGTENL